MGNRFSRRRESPAASSSQTAVTAQKPAEQPAAPQPAEEPTQPKQTQDTDTEDLDVVVGDPVTPVVCLPSEECISEFKEVQASAAPATQNDADPKVEAKETPALPQPELLVSISTASLPEVEPAAEPESVLAEAQLAPEPESEAGTKAESVPEPVCGSAAVPTEVLEQQTDFLSQELLPEPKPFSTTSTDHHVSDLTPQPVNTSPPPTLIPDPDTADEPSDNTLAEGGQDSTEAAQSSTSDPEKPKETPESLENPVEKETAGYSEQPVIDVNKESISELLQNLELKGNDLLADLIPSDVSTPDDTPITDAPTSNELM
ncbi:uncharacterized protein LOC115056974 [Echeneis naucrates]|uniref:uncharacterized protein LOC115056974 n=1 Tax=Echeneis naucrates TaxID=173247 RepID=UPI001113A9CC|nr:uncharacterized protein LOC115056974 [Echeneis naucrates]